MSAGPDLKLDLAVLTKEADQLMRERARPIHAGNFVLPARACREIASTS